MEEEDVETNDNFDNESCFDDNFDIPGDDLNSSWYNEEEVRGDKIPLSKGPPRKSGPPLSVIAEESRIETEFAPNSFVNNDGSDFWNSGGLGGSLPQDNDIDFESSKNAMERIKIGDESYFKDPAARFNVDDPRFHQSYCEKENSWEPSPPQHYRRKASNMASSEHHLPTTPVKPSSRLVNINKSNNYSRVEDEVPLTSHAAASDPLTPQPKGPLARLQKQSPDMVVDMNNKASTPKSRNSAPIPHFDISAIQVDQNDSRRVSPPKAVNDLSNLSEVSSINMSEFNRQFQPTKFSKDCVKEEFQRLERARKRDKSTNEVTNQLSPMERDRILQKLPGFDQILKRLNKTDRTQEITRKTNESQVASSYQQRQQSVGQQQQSYELQQQQSLSQQQQQVQDNSRSVFKPPLPPRSMSPTMSRAASAASIVSTTSSRQTSSMTSNEPLRIASKCMMFGYLEIGDTEEKSVTMLNRSDEPFRVKVSLRKENANYTIVTPSIVTLNPNQSSVVTVKFTPSETARLSNNLFFNILGRSKTYSVELRGHGGQSHLIAEWKETISSKTRSILATNNHNNFSLSVKNIGIRTAYCKVVLTKAGRPLQEHYTVEPSNQFIVKREETIKIIVNVPNLQSVLTSESCSRPSSCAPYSRNNSFSSQSSHSSYSDVVLQIFWGEECQRQRFKAYCTGINEDLLCHGQSFIGNFKGEQDKFNVPEYMPVRKADFEIFSAYLREINITIISPVARTNANSIVVVEDADETIRADTTIINTRSEDHTVVSDVTVASSHRRN